MVDIAPFAAVRYSADKVGRLSDVIAPPYDVISPEGQDALYARHANNIIRIDLTKAEPGEPEDGRYARANATLDAWMKSGVLAKDGAPAFYVLAQTFTGPDGVKRTRTGFFSRARLTAWDEGPILPHERTLRGPKIDRLKLMRATHYNLSPIFGTYRDPKQEVLAALEEAKKSAPIAEATMDGTENRMWRIDYVADQDRIRNALSMSKLYIADGHHRYETGIAYRDERRAEAAKHGHPHGTPPGLGGDTLPPGFESILMFASAVEDPGMVIFPTHRLVHSLHAFDEAALWRALEPFFERTEAPANADDAKRALAEAGKRGNAYLAITKRSKNLLLAKRSAPWDSVPALPAHQALRSLDVAVLHAVVIEHALGISPEAQATQANLRYSKDAKEAFESPQKSADVEVAFLMNPTKIEEVLDVAESGQVMPQKSTFFYPKIPSGLVLYSLD
jgi:uncharacterized protein (DUF1015 family)